MSVNVLIVGCGAVIHGIYKSPLQKLEKQGELTVACLVDSNLKNAVELGRFFPGAMIFDDLSKALPTCDSKLTIVASPAALHAKHTIEALRGGSHVLCEKPMALTLEEGKRMVHEAHSSGTRLGVGMTRRFYPSLVRLKGLIEGGEIGFPLTFSYREGAQYAWPVMTGSSFRRESGGGGVLADKGSHVFDVMLWLFGPFSVLSYEDDAMVGGVEANCTIRIRSERAEGRIQLSWDQDLHNEFRIVGSKQEALMDPDQLDYVRIGQAGAYGRIDPRVSFPASSGKGNVTTGTPRTYGECIYYQLVQMLRAIELNEKVSVTGEEATEVISAISECYGIAKPLDMPWLPDEQNKTYRQLHWRTAR
jgi:predicted dehydrogenase